MKGYGIGGARTSRTSTPSSRNTCASTSPSRTGSRPTPSTPPAFQCWTSIQQNYGCATCLTMACSGDQLLPCACEVDIAGVTGMYALALASGNAAAIVDWNNNYGEDRDKCVAQHCGNYPKSFFARPVQVSNLSVLSTVIDPELLLRRHRRQGGARAVHLPALLDRRPERPDSRLRGRRPVHRRSVQHARVDRGVPGAEPAEAAQVHLQAGLRAPLRAGAIPGAPASSTRPPPPTSAGTCTCMNSRRA